MGVAVWFNAITWVVVGAFTALNLVLLVAYTERGGGWRARVTLGLRRLTGRGDIAWLDWVPVWTAGIAVFAGVTAYGILTGQYGCHPPSDAAAVVGSGQAFWAGHDPFRASACGSTHEVPYGLAAVVIDAVGSLGGVAAVYAVWGFVAFAIVPLVWAVGGIERRPVLLYVGSSVLLIPLVSSQIDGVTNAIVPTTVLLTLYLARKGRRGELGAVALGGFLSTARFPNLLPVLGAAGRMPRRSVAVLLGVGVFTAATVASYLVWGGSFLGPVFLDQVGRRSFSVNLYGVLLLGNALPSSLLVEGIEGGLTLAVLVAAGRWARTPLLAAAIVLTGFALITPFLSFNFLIWLLPIALVGARARWWLWGIGTVGAVNYTLALNVWFWDDGVAWPSAVMDVALTALLLALFLELWRCARRERSAAAAARSGPGAPAGPAASHSPP